MLKTTKQLAAVSAVLASITVLPAFAQTPHFMPLNAAINSIVPHNDIIVYGSGIEKNIILMINQQDDWQETLSKSLASANLQYTQRGRVIKITPLPSNQNLAATGGGETSGFSTTQSAETTTGTSLEASSQQSVAPQPTNIVANGLDIESVTAPPPPPPAKPSEPISVEPGHVSPTLVPTPVAPAVVVQAPVQTWTLMGGSLLSKDLIGWGQQAGWSVQWNMTQTPVVPSTTNISGDFKTAITEVVRALRAEGVDVRVIFYNYPGSNTVVLTSASADNSGNASLNNTNNQ